MNDPSFLTINIDGAARGNPGPAAFAYVIVRDSEPLIEEAGRLGSVTNNVAEYTALVRALERAAELGGKRLLIRSDSELLVKQMNGSYRVKNDQLKVLHQQASRLCDQFTSIAIIHVPRSANAHADRLCNEVLDGIRESAKPTSRGDKPAATPSWSPRAAALRAEVLDCLRSAATAWKSGDSAAPSPEEIWDQLWSILEESGVLRSPRR
jgi:ribonuclease HI